MRISVIFLTALLALPLSSATPEIPAYQRFMSPASPQELVAARKVDRVAWVDYAEGKRNAYTAAAPLFTPVRLTNFMKDDGIMMSAITISDDGSTVIFLRGEAPIATAGPPTPPPTPTVRSTRSGQRGPPAAAHGEWPTPPTPSSRPMAARSSSSRTGRSIARKSRR